MKFLVILTVVLSSWFSYAEDRSATEGTVDLETAAPTAQVTEQKHEHKSDDKQVELMRRRVRVHRWEGHLTDHTNPKPSETPRYCDPSGEHCKDTEHVEH